MTAPSFRAVLFDLDGTLLDTLEDLAVSMNIALSRMGLATHPVEDYRFLVGDGVQVLARRVLPPTHQDEASIARCVELMLAEYKGRWDRKSRPYPGVPDLLDALTVRKLRLAVLSNKLHSFTRLVVARLLPDWRFAAVEGLRPDTPRKPDPAAALRIAGELNLPPRQFLYLGDTNTDMQTAGAAGMFPVGALWGFRTAGELRSAGARVLIEKPMDLLALL